MALLATSLVAAASDRDGAVRLLQAEALHERAPQIEVVDASGASVDLDSLRGHPILLHFWATWCEPCRREIPALVALARDLSGDVRVIAIGIDEAPLPPVPEWMPRTGLVVAYARSGSVSASYWTWGVPVTYVVDRTGELRYRLRGPRDWTDAKTVSALRTLLE